MNQAKAIKKHAAQHDLFNRLHSIAADEQFVHKVAHEWYGDRFEVVANQRCGTWYCDPSTSSSAYAYFKSTDGHTLNWDFNLRRSNLSLATHAERVGGIILVDSTRRGKRMPDGLSKTVPIWCAVVNRALSLRRSREEGSSPCDSSWDTALYLPGQIVSPSERAQIEDKLDGWAEDLEQSVLPLPNLKMPLRPFFVHPATSRPPDVPQDRTWTPIICLSASRWVNDGESGDVVPTATRVGGMFSTTVAFDYVPGAGDDDELWAQGLKPPLYHKCKEQLLSTARDALPSAVDDITRDDELSRALEHDVSLNDTSAVTLDDLWKAATPVSSTLLLGLGKPLQPEDTPVPSTAGLTVRVVELDKPRKDVPTVIPVNPSLVVFGIPSSRGRAKDYVGALDDLSGYVETHLPKDTALLLSPGKVDEYDAAIKLLAGEDNPSQDIHLSQPTGPQVQASRKTILPVAVALFCKIPQLGGETVNVDKITTADALHQMVALWPDGNPPRASLKRVNEFLMSERS